MRAFQRENEKGSQENRAVCVCEGWGRGKRREERLEWL